MTAEKDEQKLSRRARRRAEQAGAVASAEADASRDEESSDEDESADDDERADEDEERAAPKAKARAELEPERPKKASKSEKKRAKQAEKFSTAEIRDRNKRVREQAAERRRGKRDKSKKAATARGLDTSEMVDDAFARGTHAATQFVRRHFNVIQYVIVAVIAGGIGWQIYTWRSGKVEAKSSDKLMEGVDAELARVGAEPPQANPDEAPANPRPTFATEEARLEAAAKAYDAAEKERAGSGTSILASLGKAGVLYDQGKFDEAKSAYERVKGSPLAQHDSDVKFRAIEGIGLSLEAKGDSDGALKVFAELEKSDEPGFSGLGLYHEARVYLNKGDKDKAKQLVTQLSEKLVKDRAPLQGSSYLDRASRELMSLIDPTIAPPSSGSYSQEQLDALKSQIMKDPTKLKKMLEDMGKMKAPSIPVPIQPEPGGPAPDEAPPGPEPGSPEPEAPGTPGTGTPAP